MTPCPVEPGGMYAYEGKRPFYTLQITGEWGPWKSLSPGDVFVVVSAEVDLPDIENPNSARWMMLVSSRQGISRHVVRMTYLKRLVHP